NFLTGRKTTQRHELFDPGLLTAEAEEDAILRLQASNTHYIFILNRPTPEYGARAFGQDYYTRLMGWINQHYHVTRVFGENRSPDIQIGAKEFFIKVYTRNE